MIEITAKIKHEYGLHMRPAMLITDAAAKFNCDIRFYKDDKEADGKSIVEVSMLAAAKGEEITIRAEGEDEQNAVNVLKELVESNFENLLEVEK